MAQGVNEPESDLPIKERTYCTSYGWYFCPRFVLKCLALWPNPLCSVWIQMESNCHAPSIQDISVSLILIESPENQIIINLGGRPNFSLIARTNSKGGFGVITPGISLRWEGVEAQIPDDTWGLCVSFHFQLNGPRTATSKSIDTESHTARNQNVFSCY